MSSGHSLTHKLFDTHRVAGQLMPGSEVAIAIDQTLTQDATGTMVYLAFESLGIPRVRTERSVSYVDHNTLQVGFENADDHAFLRSVAEKYGIYFSPAGNGICHQVHLERFGVPGKTLIGSDSHTPTAGALGMLAIGVGGLDVALALAGEPYYVNFPSVVNVVLTGTLKPFVSAKDVILELLRRCGVKGGVGKVFEYSGPGVASLSVPERATITNMGAELGLTTSVFPSDAITKAFLVSQGRAQEFRALAADPDAKFTERIELALDSVVPLAACPHSPDAVKPVSELKNLAIDQVAIGSCTNSSYKDLMTVARILKGQRIPPRVSVVISPGSRQVLEFITKSGALADLIGAGARILENTCGPCIGMGQAPRGGGVSLRTFNRNFAGRSGTLDAQVYLVSPETAAVSALRGRLTDPRTCKKRISIRVPSFSRFADTMIIPPKKVSANAVIERGANIKPLPLAEQLPDTLIAPVLIVLGDNISTDDILPGGAKILPLRSNIPAISEYTFSRLDAQFVARAKATTGGCIVGGINYGQGSSREHAALAPMYLGVRAVIAVSFARIHRKNLINYGILPLIFADQNDHDRIHQGDTLTLRNVHTLIRGGDHARIEQGSTAAQFEVRCDLSSREREILGAGGLLNFVKQKNIGRA